MESVSGALQNVEGPIVEDEFDEEAVEIDGFEIEQLVENFVNEPSIQHDEIPKSEFRVLILVREIWIFVFWV